MASKKKFKGSTEDRFKLAKKRYDAGEYTSIDEAAKDNGISPATYYNYSKREATPAGNRQAPEKDLLSMVRSLEGEIAKLKDKIVDVLILKN